LVIKALVLLPSILRIKLEFILLFL